MFGLLLYQAQRPRSVPFWSSAFVISMSAFLDKKPKSAPFLINFPLFGFFSLLKRMSIYVVCCLLENKPKAIENWAGEYILNASKDNLKVGIIRGKIKLENVQLDGDLIGSHILGAAGLSDFGVLSCWAKELRIDIPWGSLESSPTRFEISGVHLVCVPLLPSTTARVYGGSGVAGDPRCTLRTRAKRSALARFERNFFAGRIADEGPRAQIDNPGNAQNIKCDGNDSDNSSRISNCNVSSTCLISHFSHLHARKYGRRNSAK